MVFNKKGYVIIIMVLTVVCSLIATTTTTRVTRRSLMQTDPTEIYNTQDTDLNRYTRQPLPPNNLTARIIDAVNVRLDWEEPTDLIRIFYHNQHAVDGYIQLRAEAYGTVFDLTEYPDATLELLDFRHSDWDVIGEWAYRILAINWDNGQLLGSYNGVTTVNDDWETDISLDSLPGVDFVGIFIVPLGHQANDAFPVVDFDNHMGGNSLIIDAANYEVIQVADGDFLIDLRIRPEQPGRNTQSDTISAPRRVVSRNMRNSANNYRNPLGYNVYRDDFRIATIDNPEIFTYLDENLPDETYSYYVTAIYEDEVESEPSNIVIVNIIGDMVSLFYDDFSSYPDFVTTFPPWITIDLDGLITFGFTNYSFPNEYQPMAFIVFNPSATTPPMTATSPHSGTKMLASFASENNASNNWLISPRLTLGTNSNLSFWARSYTAQYGLDRFRVGLSVTEPDPGSFQIIYPPQPEPYEEPPVFWNKYNIDLTEWDNQAVYLAINVVSDRSFVMFLDTFEVTTVGGSNVEQTEQLPVSRLNGNYPNPFNPETTIHYYLEKESFTTVEIYNVMGQKITTLKEEYHRSGAHKVNWDGKDSQRQDAASGVYYYRIVTDTDTKTGKMLLLK